MNIIDKAISVISPQWAYERVAYREYLKAYEAGEVNRFNDTWMPINADTENTDKNERDLIKARARYLERNSDIAGAAIGGIVRNVVGTGIKPQARTGNEKLNNQLELLWKEWVKHTSCDITMQQTFYELQAMLLKRKIVDGEILIRLVIDKKAKIPFKLQVIKSDLLDSYIMNAPKTNNIIRSGIELDDYLRPLAYWIQRKSPDGYVTYESERIPANQIIHLWIKSNPDQIRGVSDLAPVIKRLKDMQDFLDAETVAAKIAACFSVFIVKNSPSQFPGVQQNNKKDKEGKLLSSIRPGMVSHLRPGEDIKTANPSRSMTTAKDFINVQQRLAGAGMGLSYELMSRDFNGATFSSARQGHLEDRRTFEPVQQYLIYHLCQPIWEQFVDMCVLGGLVSIRDYAQNREVYTYAEWVTPGWSWIDPEKEVKADLLALKNSGKTLAQWCAERGYDWKEQLSQMAKEKEFAESIGLTLSIHTPESVQAAESNHKEEKNDNEK